VVASTLDGPEHVVRGVIHAAAAFTGRAEDEFTDDCTIVALTVR
jgi:hypothetical protein